MQSLSSLSISPVRDKINPFLKWAGGKRWLTQIIDPNSAESFDRYVEPFLGSGALFFSLQPPKAVLSDINADLINLYNMISEMPDEMLALMRFHQMHHSVEHYYAMRSLVSDSRLEQAARFLYLNRTCWNGLYRVNRKGVFNVPKGTKETVLFPGEDFRSAAKILNKAKIVAEDFETILTDCRQGDFVFIDPPYALEKRKDSFTKYTENVFDWKDQIRLRDVIAELCRRRVSLIITNAYNSSIIDLYRGIAGLVALPLSRHSVLAGVSGSRLPVAELFCVTADLVNALDGLFSTEYANKTSFAAGPWHEIVNV